MIRLTVIGALTLLLVFVLYLPSAHPPSRFIEQMLTEHGLNTRFWGPTTAERIMDRSLSAYGVLNSSTPVPQRSQAPAPARSNIGIASEMARVNERLFGNSYFRAVDALVLLATYRWASLMQWCPALTLLLSAMLVDGWIVRLVRSLQFQGPSPEWFAVSACAAVLLSCGTFVCWVLPLTVPPLAWGGMLMAVGVCASQLIANYHHRP